jgi:hypothetical protein
LTCKRLALLLLLGALHLPFARAQTSGLTPQQILQRYQEASAKLSGNLNGASMEVKFIGKLPYLEKEGEMEAIRTIAPDGSISYKSLDFTGDDVIKRHVIARYMTAEVEATQTMESDIAINERNYRFDYKGLVERFGLTVHVFELRPRHKRVGLFQGELWIDPETFMPVREYGLFVRSPSVFLRDVYFVRDYWILDGVAVPRRIISNIDVRLVGEANLEIWFSDWDKGGPAAPKAAHLP